MEGIITQLVFSHALRIRMKAEASDKTEQVHLIATASPDSMSLADQPSSSNSEDQTLRSSVDSSSVEANSQSSKGKQKEPVSASAPAKSDSTADNLVGKMNNLVTTDLNNITQGRDFLLLRTNFHYLITGSG